jgi:hypothetical protein
VNQALRTQPQASGSGTAGRGQITCVSQQCLLMLTTWAGGGAASGFLFIIFELNEYSFSVNEYSFFHLCIIMHTKCIFIQAAPHSSAAGRIFIHSIHL